MASGSGAKSTAAPGAAPARRSESPRSPPSFTPRLVHTARRAVAPANFDAPRHPTSRGTPAGLSPPRRRRHVVRTRRSPVHPYQQLVGALLTRLRSPPPATRWSSALPAGGRRFERARAGRAGGGGPRRARQLRARRVVRLGDFAADRAHRHADPARRRARGAPRVVRRGVPLGPTTPSTRSRGRAATRRRSSAGSTSATASATGRICGGCRRRSRAPPPLAVGGPERPPPTAAATSTPAVRPRTPGRPSPPRSPRSPPPPRRPSSRPPRSRRQWRRAAAAGVTAAGTNALALVYGNAAGSTSALGAPFSPLELRVLVRSLIFDRSLLGDTLAPLRAACPSAPTTWPSAASATSTAAAAAAASSAAAARATTATCRAPRCRAPSAAAVEFVANCREQAPQDRAHLPSALLRRPLWPVPDRDGAPRPPVGRRAARVCAEARRRGRAAAARMRQRVRARESEGRAGAARRRLARPPPVSGARHGPREGDARAARRRGRRGRRRRRRRGARLPRLGQSRARLDEPARPPGPAASELNVLVRDAAFCRELDGALDGCLRRRAASSRESSCSSTRRARPQGAAVLGRAGAVGGAV